jgi:hypothetical protein
MLSKSDKMIVKVLIKLVELNRILSLISKIAIFDEC